MVPTQEEDPEVGDRQGRSRRAPVSVSGLTLPPPALGLPEACTSQATPLRNPTSGRGHHKLQAQDSPGSKNEVLSKLLYVLPRGKVAQGCVGTDLWASAW